MTRMKLPVADVDRDHARRAPLEQDVREAARRRADVERVETGRVDAERVERVRELLAAAGDVRGASDDRELGALVHLLAGLVVAGHEPGHDESLRLRSRRGEAALCEQHVEALLHETEIPQVPANVSPGSSRITSSPVRNAFGGQVIGSTASARLATSGRGSPVKSCTCFHASSAQTVTSLTWMRQGASRRSGSSSRLAPISSPFSVRSSTRPVGVSM